MREIAPTRQFGGNCGQAHMVALDASRHRSATWGMSASKQWSTVLPVVAAVAMAMAAACGFPRPADVPDPNADDGGPTGCTGDQACSAPTPFCLDGACVACKSSNTCPAARPACDAVSHECRTCVKDAECDSGACDLAAGTCVDPSKILYASPAGTMTDPCARLLPCSLEKASSVAGPEHPYIVLLPGTHVSIARFFQQTATICGNGATVDASVVRIEILDGVLAIRDLNIAVSNTTISHFGGITTIYAQNSELTLSNVNCDETTLSFQDTVFAYPKVSIQKSGFRGSQLNLAGNIVLDESDFQSTFLSLSRQQTHPIRVSNSVFDASHLSILDGADASPLFDSFFIGNTFFGGQVSCNEGQDHATAKRFNSNIFLSTSGIQQATGCIYDFNLIQPMATVNGANNVTGDPKFVDAAHSDFHLQGESPAINMADPFPPSANTHDHDGNARPEGPRSDIGAFEYSP